MNNLLVRLNNLRWYNRLPLKWAILGLTYFFVCFPYPAPTWRHFGRLANPNILVQPDAPSLQPWVDELRGEMTPGLTPREAMKQVESFVYKKVPYEWDWNTWGLVDYFPTVDEVVATGKEDCDGRAIVAASVLRKLGYDARLVTNFAHMWVATSEGELMSPGRTKIFEATDQGMRMHFQLAALEELPRSAMFGISVFPLARELVIVLALWAVFLRPRGGVGTQLVALGFMVNALLFFRMGVVSYDRQYLWRHAVGAGNLLAALAALYGWAQMHARRSLPPRTV